MSRRRGIRREEKRLDERTAFLLGLAGLLAIAAFVYGAFAKDVPFTQGYRVEGVFSSSNQIREGSPVRIAGVPVGKVVGLEPGPGSTGVVVLEVNDDGRPVHVDATLRIRPRVFLEGSYYVELEPGSPTSPELPDGGTIPLAQTSIPVQFDQILGAFDSSVRDSLGGFLKETSTALEGGGAEGFARAMPHLAPALRDAAIAFEAFRGSDRHDVSDGIEGTSRLLAAMARRDRELAGLVENLNRTTGALAAEDDSLSASLRELDGTLAEAPPALDALDRALPPLERFTADIRPALPPLPSVLSRTADVLDDLEVLVRPAQLPLLVRRLQPTAEELPTLAARLRPLFDLVAPVTGCVATHILPVLKAEVEDGHLSSGRPVWQDMVHTFVGLASAGQSFDANGPSLRLSGGVSEQAIPLLGGLGGGDAFTGTRPRWFGPGSTLPKRPDAPCLEQELPDLSARTGLG